MDDPARPNMAADGARCRREAPRLMPHVGQLEHLQAEDEAQPVINIFQ